MPPRSATRSLVSDQVFRALLEALLSGRYGRLRTVVVAPGGSLWVTTSNRDGRGSPRSGDDRIIRFTP